MKLTKLASATLLSLATISVTQAVTLDIEVTNLTQAQSFTPRLVVAHDNTVDTFEVGESASSALAWLAEGGVIDDEQSAESSGENFEALLGPADTDNGSNTWHKADGLLAPKSSNSFQFDALDKPYLSLVSMLIPTNDAFVGMDSIAIPTEPGTYTYYLNAYDAGTELNDELNSARTDIVEAETGNALGGYGVPGVAGGGAPTRVVDLGMGGTGVAAQVVNGEVEDGEDGPVHIHRNALGDTDLEGGASDLDSTVHRWLNPVAKVVVTVPAS
ncbi:MAG: hypothetical protein AXW14_16565 [Alteromonas sp. Nap_26]|nr:MAG: hypothetical protein AXW14_16565 [Alteromonas sp. Nap_26]